jgi:arylsulfatase A-like enzyme
MHRDAAACMQALHLPRLINVPPIFLAHRVLIMRTLLFTGILCIITCSAAVSYAEAPRKNVLFLIADDLNTRIGCYGDKQVITPNLDRLAAQGTRFDRAYCQFPLCGPSRNSMLTGLYPDSTGIYENGQIFRQSIPSRHSLSQAFRLDGYFAGRIGKLYHYNVPNSIGTNGHDDPGSWELESNPAGCDRLLEEGEIFSMVPGSFGGVVSWLASKREDPEHTDSLLADDAIWVLERMAKQTPSKAKQRPFFLAVGFYRPHTPYVAPKKYFEPYKLAEMPYVSLEEAMQEREGVPNAAYGSFRDFQNKMTQQQHREAIQAYYASASFMDAQVGRVLDALERLGLAKDTVVVFTSDHGYHLGDHGLWQKQSLFEQSARVPLIIASPGMPQGQVVKEPVGLVDLYPTLASICEVPTKGKMQGQDLSTMLADSKASGRGYALSQVARGGGNRKNRPAMGYSLRTARYRYTQWAEGQAGHQLYDYDQDPEEKRNLADSPEHASLVASLQRQLEEAIKQSRPEDGKIPAVGANNWAPNLTAP